MNNNPSFFIQPVGVENLPELLAIYQQCEDFLALGPVPTASCDMVLADLRLSVDSGATFHGVYLSKGELVGVFDIIPSGYQGNPSLAFINLFMIAAPYRSQGLGSRVIAFMENELFFRGIQAIYLGVQVNNPQATHFWERIGFVPEGGPVDNPDGTTGRIYRKVIHPRKSLVL